MKPSKLLVAASLGLLAGPATVSAWNTPAMKVEALLFHEDGTIEFTLLDPDPAHYEFVCDLGTNSVFLKIDPCDIGVGNGKKATNPNCNVAVDRMAELLLRAKIEQIPVHVFREDCKVVQTSLKPLS
jgi:hypothetical protein